MKKTMKNITLKWNFNEDYYMKTIQCGNEEYRLFECRDIKSLSFYINNAWEILKTKEWYPIIKGLKRSRLEIKNWIEPITYDILSCYTTYFMRFYEPKIFVNMDNMEKMDFGRLDPWVYSFDRIKGNGLIMRSQYDIRLPSGTFLDIVNFDTVASFPIKVDMNIIYKNNFIWNRIQALAKQWLIDHLKVQGETNTYMIDFIRIEVQTEAGNGSKSSPYDIYVTPDFKQYFPKEILTNIVRWEDDIMTWSVLFSTGDRAIIAAM